ncbi:30S ribosomal protein S9, mitochondrial [Tanacetum coccineum]|uniref:30S ribosomal protein S9, mitochondrial n=1 Tax=Tanacetum coccineum TaxID=301880 RepID=A0ABQ5BKH2_9ASTR
MIRTWEDIMRAYDINFSGSYQLSIQCAPFKALYGRKCKSPVLWAKIGESSLIGPEFVQETTDKVILIKENLKAARDRQKSYVDCGRKPLEFEVGDRVLLKEPVEIMDREVKSLKRSRIPLIEKIIGCKAVPISLGMRRPMKSKDTWKTERAVPHVMDIRNPKLHEGKGSYGIGNVGSMSSKELEFCSCLNDASYDVSKSWGDFLAGGGGNADNQNGIFAMSSHRDEKVVTMDGILFFLSFCFHYVKRAETVEPLAISKSDATSAKCSTAPEIERHHICWGKILESNKEYLHVSKCMHICPDHAFGYLIAASGITDDMLDSLMALKDIDDVPGLPPLSTIEDMHSEKNTRKFTRADIERQKQEELANAHLRQVDSQGRAYGTGKRKCSIARVWIEPGEGKFLINDNQFDVYFPMLDQRAALLRPLTETKTLGLLDVNCTVKVGGVSAGFLTRDSRIVERKKPGKAKARKSFQWVKR